MIKYKKLFFIPTMSLFCAFIACIGLIVINMGYNEIRNRRFANQLYNYPLPPQTKVLHRETTCFCPPNGGTCVLDFSEVLETELSREEIEAYYAGIGFPGLGQDIISKQEVYVDIESIKIGDNSQFKASIGEAFYSGGLFDWRCSQ